MQRSWAWVAGLVACALGCLRCTNDTSAWCDRCMLEARISDVESPDSTDCGIAERDAGADVLQCIGAALVTGDPFTAVQKHQGADSVVRTAWVQTDDGTLYRLSYDSNICGGIADCDERCGPRIERIRCASPQLDDTTRDGIRCADGEDWETLCEPPDA